MTKTVAALYVDPKGAYAGLPGVDAWGEERDARLYMGPHPVVAHPPCTRWCQLAYIVQKRYGHKVGDDGGCFASALDAVEMWGGVLEHPARSRGPALGCLYPYAASGHSGRAGGWPRSHRPRTATELVS